MDKHHDLRIPSDSPTFQLSMEPDLKHAFILTNGDIFPDMRCSFFSLQTDQGIISSAQSQDITLRSDSDKRVELIGRTESVPWSVKCECICPESITFTVTLKPLIDIHVERAMLFNVCSERSPVIAQTSLQDIAVFYRNGDFGLFASVDFPYSKILTEPDNLSLSYPVFQTIKAGKEYVFHSVTVGITRLTGKCRYGYYEGEVEAIDQYIQTRFTPRFDRPIFTSASIINRFTQLQNDWVFYTMKNQPTLTFNRDILKRELELMHQLGVEFYQVFPGVFDWGLDDPSQEMVREAMDWAKANDIRMGDYSGTQEVFCPHYNQYRYSTKDIGVEPCFGNEEFVEWYARRVADNAERFGFEVHVLDFLSIGVCDNPNHQHPTGQDSIYFQIRGITRIMDRIAAVSENMLVWPNSGCWSELLPKIAWHAPSQYLTDPFIDTPWQGLNQTRLLDDARRQQMVDLHYSHFVPYRFFTNCQYFFSQNSVVPDIRNYEYGALSTLAVTPNLCPAEIRPWIESLSPVDQQRVVDFYSKWTSFIKENFDLWKRTYHTQNDPAPGSVEIYSHAKGNHGFLFLVNSTYHSSEVEISLDKSLGFSGTDQCEIVELYPCEKLVLTEQGPFVTLGTKTSAVSEPQSVKVLEIRPKPEIEYKPKLYGIAGTLEPVPEGYLLKTAGAQGTVQDFAVLLPEHSDQITSIQVEENIPNMDRRQWDWEPTTATLVASGTPGALIRLTLRRQAATRDVTGWRVAADTLEHGLESLYNNEIISGQQTAMPVKGQDIPLANFQGAYIENAFSEDQNTQLLLRTDCSVVPETLISRTDQLNTLIAVEKHSPDKVSLPDLSEMPCGDLQSSSWWMQAEFSIPLTYWGGCEPRPEEHTLLVLPFTDQQKVKEIRAWINGTEVDILIYHYPRNRSLTCRYADLTGSPVNPGQNRLVLYIDTECPQT